MPRPRRRSVPVTLKFVAEQVETERAYLLVMETGEEVWLPKSQITFLDWENGTLQVPRWLAEEKGLVAPQEDPAPRPHRLQ